MQPRFFTAGAAVLSLVLTVPGLAQDKKPGDLKSPTADTPPPVTEPQTPSTAPAGEISAETQALIDDCDALAADPGDSQRPVGVPGVEFTEIAPIRATIACEQAHLAAPDHARTTYQLARVYDAASDFARAARLYGEAMSAGYTVAGYALAVLYLDENALGTDWAKAVPSLRVAAEAGHPAAQFELAWSCLKGLGQPADSAAALRWYARAAEQGHAPAQYELGWVYFEGTAGEVNFERAYYWYSRAAEQGHRIALNDLGYMYEMGYFVGEDLEKAVDYYRQAAEQGLASAQSNLAYMYESGRGVAQDYTEAANWYRKAADQGDTRGMLDLGALYFLGNGVEEDSFEAFQLFERARAAGDLKAYVYLGNLFEFDEEHGDPERAASYYIDGLRAGNDWPIRRESGDWSRDAAQAMQRQLRDLGVYNGPIDGVIGPGTRAAMRQLLGG